MGNQPFNETPTKKLSVIITTIIDIIKPIIPNDKKRIGRVISLNIQPIIRLTIPSININVNKD